MMNQLNNLKIWSRAVDLAILVYKTTQNFPEEERFGLTSQIRRCSVSISSNIAEGAGRSTNKEFDRFLSIAYGSSYELETQLYISKRLGFIDSDNYEVLATEIDELQKMIYSLSKRLQTSS